MTDKDKECREEYAKAEALMREEIKMREAFEARKIPNLNLKRRDDGSYYYDVTAMAFRDFCDGAAWQQSRLLDEELVEVMSLALYNYTREQKGLPKVTKLDAVESHNLYLYGMARAAIAEIKKHMEGV